MTEKNEMKILRGGKLQKFKLHQTIEFDSTRYRRSSYRKRQSVIIEATDESIWIYTKGADNVILERPRKDLLKTYPFG